MESNREARLKSASSSCIVIDNEGYYKGEREKQGWPLEETEHIERLELGLTAWKHKLARLTSNRIRSERSRRAQETPRQFNITPFPSH